MPIRLLALILTLGDRLGIWVRVPTVRLFCGSVILVIAIMWVWIPSLLAECLLTEFTAPRIRSL